jgi:phosphoserine phosphatase
LTSLLNKKPKLVVFDVEGVLIPRNRFFFLMGKTLGFAQLMKVFFYGFLYEIGLVPLKSAMKHLFSGAQGMKLETLMQIALRIPLVPEAKTVFERLRLARVTALIISGRHQ